MTTYVLCIVMVFSYIFFDILDIDGSDFPLTQAAKPVYTAEVSHDFKRAYPEGPLQTFQGIPILFDDRPTESVHIMHTKRFRSSPLDLARARGYRVALPRASIADPSPSA